MTPEERLIKIIVAAPHRKAVLAAVAALGLPDSWVAGGFIRNAVWDALYEKADTAPVNDVDVVYFKPLAAYGMPESELVALIRANEMNSVWEEESQAQAELERAFPFTFEVKNQARMHLSPAKTHVHAAYTSITEALSDWVETATPVGVRIGESGKYETIAPRGLDDLFAGVLRSTRKDYNDRMRERAAAKGWLTRWPQLRVELCKG